MKHHDSLTELQSKDCKSKIGRLLPKHQHVRKIHHEQVAAPKAVGPWKKILLKIL